MSKRTSRFVVPIIVACACTAARAESPRITVDVQHLNATVSPTQFGHIIEDINHCVEGGLYANMLRNSDFKEDHATPKFWAAVGGADIRLDGRAPLNAQHPAPLAIRASDIGGAAGAANEGFFGVGVRPSTDYTVKLMARSDGSYTGPLQVRLVGSDETVYAEAHTAPVGNAWQQLTAHFSTSGDAPLSTDNRFTVTMVNAAPHAAVWIDLVECMPPTVAPDMPVRADLYQMLANTHPGFFRVPGGNYMEGNILANRFIWKQTLGPRSARPGHANDAWGYWSSDGMGLMEYLQLAEHANAQTLLVVFSGYTLNRDIVAERDMGPFVQDALDEIEYAMGDTSTPWGARRAADGHPAPFDVRMVQIGNEDFFDPTDTYNRYRFPMLFDAIRAKYPHLKIMTSRNDVTSRQADYIDDHFYNDDPLWFARNAHMYDSASRQGPKILVGEYASLTGPKGNPTNQLIGALGEAAFMVGMLRNADVVIGGAYAPALANLHGYQWGTNMIAFDAAQAYASPSYHVQKMMGTHLGAYTVGTDITDADPLVITTATRNLDGSLYLTVVNPTAQTLAAHVALQGSDGVGAAGRSVTLSGDPHAANTMAQPHAVQPVEGQFQAASEFDYTFAAYSVTILEMPVQGRALATVQPNRGLTLQTDHGVLAVDNSGSLIVSPATTQDLPPARRAATFIAHPGLADPDCYSLESRYDNAFLYATDDGRVTLATYDPKDSAAFATHTTFCPRLLAGGHTMTWHPYNALDKVLQAASAGVQIVPSNGSGDTPWNVAVPLWRSDVDLPLHRAISLQATTPVVRNQTLRHKDYFAELSPISKSSTLLDRQDGTFIVRDSLADISCYSFEARNKPGYFLRHYFSRLRIDRDDGSQLFREDATFCAKRPTSSSGVVLQSYNYPSRAVRHFAGKVWIAGRGGELASDHPNFYDQDTTWQVTYPWAPLN